MSSSKAAWRLFSLFARRVAIAVLLQRNYFFIISCSSCITTKLEISLHPLLSSVRKGSRKSVPGTVQFKVAPDTWQKKNRVSVRRGTGQPINKWRTVNMQ